MTRPIVLNSLQFAALTFVLACSSVRAETINIDFADRGFYNQLGDHNPTNSNYFVGDSNNDFVFHNFFVFDLSTVTQPIASAKLALFNPIAPLSGYFSPDPSENFELYDVSAPIASLLNGTGGISAYTDLGSGIAYGNREMSAADDGSVVEISLNSAAIAAIEAANGLFAIGGSLTTLDHPASDEHVFGFTNTSPVTQLKLTLVPEPTPFSLGLIALGATTLHHRRSRRIPQEIRTSIAHRPSACRLAISNCEGM